MKYIGVLLGLFAVVSCTQVEDYLKKYGYYNPNSFGNEDVKTAIKTFQQSFNLAITGKVDNATKALMKTPRCGNPDRNANAFADSKWNKNSLTYYISNFSPDLTQSQIESITARALKFWSDVTPLKFTRTSSQNGDIIIGFGSGSHSDTRQRCGFPFDGPSGTLAHAFFPPDGRLHYDDAERWTDNSYQGQNLLSTAVHELGHILGLEHDSSTKDSIMYPYSTPYNPNLKLHANDIRRIQYLYGSKTSTGGGSVIPPGNCRDDVVDCINWKNRCTGYSQAWTDYMNKHCKQTCNKC